MSPALSGSHEPHGRVLVMAFQGWSDAGNAATNALGYLERGLDAEVLHVIGSEDFVDLQMFRPVIIQHDDGTRSLEWPDTRLLGPVMRPGLDTAAVDSELGHTDRDDRVRNLDGSQTLHVYLLDATEPAHHWRT